MQSWFPGFLVPSPGSVIACSGFLLQVDAQAAAAEAALASLVDLDAGAGATDMLTTQDEDIIF